MWGRRRPRAASRGRRAIADTIDGVIVLIPWAGYIAFQVFASRGDPPPSRAKPSVSVNRALQLLSLAVRVARERGRTPGYRIVGLRTVNAQTGAEIGVPTAIVRVAVQQLPGLLVRALTGRERAEMEARTKARHERMDALKPELAALRAEHADDPDALNEARMRLYETHGVNAFESCLPALKPAAATLLLSTVTRRLLDRLAGKPIVVER